MKKVFKYPLTMIDQQFISLPEGAKILRVDTQGNVPMLWALVEPNNPFTGRQIRIAGTGHMIHGEVKYINTFFMDVLVFHAFEVLS